MVGQATKRWIVVRTRGGRENWALENATAQKFECYLPKILERVTFNDQKLSVARPLFPSYMFVLADRWRVLLSTFGIVGIVMRGSEPDCLPNRVIHDLREREGDDGIIVLPKPKAVLGPNSQVQILKGPFQGHAGVIANMRPHERARVLLDFLGRKTDVLIANSDLALIAA
jgi:transcription antitermination factor NusG